MSSAVGQDMPGRVEVRALSVVVGPVQTPRTTLDGLDFTAAPGEFVCVLGPSGCGKSTLLGAVAGHVAASAGEIVVDGERVVRPHPERGLVFQQHTLFPWKRVIDNVAFGLKMKGLPRAEQRHKAQAILELVGLGKFGSHYPSQLSGGMQQRVEIARALINQPRILLMDEPFGALDAQTRRKMQKLLLDIWTKVRTTVLFVTHDIDEALFLADRILVLSPSPARIVADIPVTMARPRSDHDTTHADYLSLKQRCLALLDQAS